MAQQDGVNITFFAEKDLKEAIAAYADNKGWSNAKAIRRLLSMALVNASLEGEKS